MEPVDVVQNPDPSAVRMPERTRQPRLSGRERAERSALALVAMLGLLWATALWAWTVRP